MKKTLSLKTPQRCVCTSFSCLVPIEKFSEFRLLAVDTEPWPIAEIVSLLALAYLNVFGKLEKKTIIIFILPSPLVKLGRYHNLAKE